MKPTPENLATIRVVFCAPDTLTFWGIPYAMRPGQAPRDLWISRNLAAILTATRHDSGPTRLDPGPREDWIYLGQSGWYAGDTAEADLARAFLADLKARGMLPENPYEWVDLRAVSR